MTGRIAASTPLIAMVLVGCATVPRDAGFADVRDAVADRLAGARVEWIRGTEADAAAGAAVRELLARPLSADDAVQVALLNNPGLQATYEDLMVAQSDVVEAGLLGNPVFEAEARFADEGTGVELGVAQAFLDVIYIPLRKRVAAAQFAAARARVTAEVVSMATQARAAHVRLQAARQTTELRRQVLTAAGASYELARRLRAAGNVTELDVANEQAVYEQAKLSLADAEADAVRRREELAELMGLWGPVEWHVATRLPALPAGPPEFDGVERRAVERSLALAAGRQEIEAAAGRLGIARPAGWLGELELGAVGEREAEGEWAVGPTLALPIPLFNQGQPANARAAAELRRAMRLHRAAAVRTRAQARTSWAAARAAHDRARHVRDVLLPLSARITGQTQLHYNAMEVGAFQLLAARRRQVEAGEQYVRALEAFWLAQAALDQALAGGLGEVPAGAPGNRVSAPGGAAAAGGH